MVLGYLTSRHMFAMAWRAMAIAIKMTPTGMADGRKTKRNRDGTMTLPVLASVTHESKP